MALLRQGLAAYQATGSKLYRPHYLFLLARACGLIGRADEGLTLLTEARTVARETGERVYDAEVCLLTGELTLQKCKAQGSRFQAQQEAEGYFRQALDVAQQQHAKSWELRAATSLARWLELSKLI